jgi:hypothetical protein
LGHVGPSDLSPDKRHVPGDTERTENINTKTPFLSRGGETIFLAKIVDKNKNRQLQIRVFESQLADLSSNRSAGLLRAA